MGFKNISNTNFGDGVSNRPSGDMFGSMGQMDPTKFIQYFNDFNAPSIDETGNNTLAGYSAPTTGLVSALTAFKGGAILLTSGGTDTNVAIIKSLTEGFNLAAGERLWFRARVALPSVSDVDMIVGLTDAITLTPGGGVFFHKADQATGVDLVVRRSAGEVVRQDDIATMANSQIFTFEFYWDGIDRVYFGVNDVPLGFVTVPDTILPTLAPTFGVITGATATKAIEVDYLFAAQER